MEIKAILFHFKKNFDRIILIAMTLVLIVFFLRYICLLRGQSVPFGEKDLYALVGIPWRVRADIVSENTFRELLDKKVNFILGIKPAIFYNRLIYRNPFVLLKDLVVKPFSLNPAALTIGVGEKFSFQTLHGIGPYRWRCEPENLGTFEDNIFEAITDGRGRIIATDARGENAITELEITAKRGAVARPRDTDRISLNYKGPMKILTPSGEEFFAVIEDSFTGKLDFRKPGEEVAGFIVKDITRDKLILFDKKKGKEVELFRE